LGASGERRAAQWYEAEGYEVLDRNWRCPDGELDLVARRGPTLVFCEVKTRRTTRFGQPFEAVTSTKQARIRRLAARWLRERGASLGLWSPLIRFDVASVLGAELQILEDAF
jgi:putative endonuclease